MTIAQRWKHLWRQHGITGGTLARILARIWFADLLADGEPYLRPSILLLGNTEQFHRGVETTDRRRSCEMIHLYRWSRQYTIPWTYITTEQCVLWRNQVLEATDRVTTTTTTTTTVGVSETSKKSQKWPGLRAIKLWRQIRRREKKVRRRPYMHIINNASSYFSQQGPGHFWGFSEIRDFPPLISWDDTLVPCTCTCTVPSIRRVVRSRETPCPRDVIHLHKPSFKTTVIVR